MHNSVLTSYKRNVVAFIRCISLYFVAFFRCINLTYFQIKNTFHQTTCNLDYSIVKKTADKYCPFPQIPFIYLVNCIKWIMCLYVLLLTDIFKPITFLLATGKHFGALINYLRIDCLI